MSSGRDPRPGLGIKDIALKTNIGEENAKI